MFYNFEKNIMDMTFEEILRLRDMAEQTSVQFKERLTKESKSEVAAEMVAMSNTRGCCCLDGRVSAKMATSLYCEMYQLHR